MKISSYFDLTKGKRYLMYFSGDLNKRVVIFTYNGTTDSIIPQYYMTARLNRGVYDEKREFVCQIKHNVPFVPVAPSKLLSFYELDEDEYLLQVMGEKV